MKYALLLFSLFVIQILYSQIYNSSGYIDQIYNQELINDFEDFDSDFYFGKKIWVEEINFKENKKIIAIYNINGQYLGNNPNNIGTGVFIYLMEYKNIKYSKKVLKNNLE